MPYVPGQDGGQWWRCCRSRRASPGSWRPAAGSPVSHLYHTRVKLFIFHDKGSNTAFQILIRYNFLRTPALNPNPELPFLRNIVYQTDITKYYLRIFAPFGPPNNLFALQKNFYFACAVKKKFFSLTIAGRRVGSGSVKKTYRCISLDISRIYSRKQGNFNYKYF